MSSRTLVSGLGVLACVLVPVVSHAFVIPSGLQPGDPFHFAFVTRDARDALDTNIATYNAFVQSQADLNPDLAGISWRAIASTSTVSARDNAVVSAPVYLLDGTGIASDFADMWDGALSHPIFRDQFGAATDAGVWTGSQADGTTWPLRFYLGGDFPEFGVSTFADSRWIIHGLHLPGDLHSLYGLSEELVVPSVPEPSTIMYGLLLIGASVARRGIRKPRGR